MRGRLVVEKKIRVIDLHCDTVLKLMRNTNGMGLLKNNLNVDLQKMQKGNYAAQFFAAYVDLKAEMDPLENALEMIDRFYMELDQNSGIIGFAGNLSDLLENDNAHRMSAFLTVEEGGVLKGRISNLRILYRLGVRLVTLTWNYPNEIGYPNYKWEYKDRGLTPFGMEVVEEMNSLGMAIDVSHLSDSGFYDVAKASKKPFCASHSNSRAVNEHPRNLSDDMIKILSDKGGIMGINFEREFLGGADLSRVEDMVRHISHIRNAGGIDIIAIGTDFDGITQNLEIKNAGEMGKLIAELDRQGFTDDDIDRITHKNAMRFIGDVMK